MADIALNKIVKRYGETTILGGISLDIRDGEFLTLVGPSGCGKSTLLRILAGLDIQDAGEVMIGGNCVDGLRPKDRNVAMVFQSYALYPHLSVFDNVALPLRVRRLSTMQRLPLVGRLLPGRTAIEGGIRREVTETAGLLDIGHLLDRKPAQLSGGQQQRVALGRAMVRHPVAFLMDEPLSNLDAKLRTQMRAEISALHRRLGATFVFVTHDQAEAMTMSDRVAVMMAGELIQVGPPDELYNDPKDLRVAEFIGSPKINVLPAAAFTQDWRNRSAIAAGATALAFRPEAAAITPPSVGELGGRIVDIENLGSDIFLHIEMAPEKTAVPVIIRIEPSSRRFSIGEDIGVRPDTARILQFDAAGRRLLSRECMTA